MNGGNSVWYSVGRTIQTKPFESIRLDIGASAALPPDKPTSKMRDVLYQELREEVDQRLNDAVQEITAMLAGGKASPKSKTTRRK